MILSVSRRTDIPAFYSEWFFERLKENYLCVRNPVNVHQVRKIISLTPDVVDCIVLWSKNPAPMIDRLHELEGYNYYFQFTLNNYGQEIEPNVPSLDERLETFNRLGKYLNDRRKIVWRYDPIFFSERYSMKFHCDIFKNLSLILSDFSDTCIISFLDKYRGIASDMRRLGIEEDNEERQRELAEKFSDIAEQNGIKINTCAEKINLSEFGIGHSSCIDKERIESISDCKLSLNKDKNQRKECGCFESIDIGAYDTCRHGCIYCYARRRKNNISDECRIDSPLMCGKISDNDSVKEERAESSRDRQKGLFD